MLCAGAGMRAVPVRQRSPEVRARSQPSGPERPPLMAQRSPHITVLRVCTTAQEHTDYTCYSPQKSANRTVTSSIVHVIFCTNWNHIFVKEFDLKDVLFLQELSMQKSTYVDRSNVGFFHRSHIWPDVDCTFGCFRCFGLLGEEPLFSSTKPWQISNWNLGLLKYWNSSYICDLSFKIWIQFTQE